MTTWQALSDRLDSGDTQAAALVTETVLKALAELFVADFSSWQEFSRLVNKSWSLGRVCTECDEE